MSSNQNNDTNRIQLNILKSKLIRKNIESQHNKNYTQHNEKNLEQIAIVGLHGFMPGCKDLNDFWDIIDNNKTIIQTPPEERLELLENVHVNDIQRFKGGFIHDIKSFDPFAFGILPNDAKIIDPQQRLLLMSVLNCINDAGYSREQMLKTNTGVYVAIEDNEYLHHLRKHNIDLGSNILNHHPSMAANRLSYYFDFKGPSEICNTMCSSAAHAIHNACQAIRGGQIKQAIVGGARILLNPDAYDALSRLNVLSKSGNISSFGQNADGYIRSEGVASILLKPLSAAQNNNDHIYAVIKNTAINYNGASGSIAYPAINRHKDLIKKCYSQANIKAIDVSYIEAQGMGNQAADSVEWESFNQALEELCSEQQLSYNNNFCAVSTLKPQIGHMESVSAFGALFRIIHSFKTNTIYRIHGLENIHPQLNTQNRPCHLVQADITWEKKKDQRHAALHSYGSGGNNAHILLTEPEYNPEQLNFKNLKKTLLKTKKLNLKWCWYQPNKIRANLVKQKTICVVGAGPSGLVMAKSLLESGHNPIVFDKQDTFGGLWNLKKNGSIGAYKSTKFQSSMYTSVFSDFCPKEFNMPFFGINDVNQYLKQYIDYFQLKQCISYQTEVLSVEEKGLRWEVKIRKDGNEEVRLFDGVALCQGSFWNPMIPEKIGHKSFTGEVIHSASYYDNSIFKNKRVLIIGNGVSAMDIASEAADVANKVYWSRRSKKLILPRMVGFVPNDFQSPAQLLLENNRTNIIERLKSSMPSYFEKLKESGLLPSQVEFEANPIVHINDNIVDQVVAKKVILVTEIAQFYETGCKLINNDDLNNIDVVVYCTGYENFGKNDKRFKYLKNINVQNDFSMGIFYQRNPTLVNTSVLPIAYTGSFYFLEMVARWYSESLNGQFKLTEQEKASRITDEHYLIMAPISSVIFGLRLGLFPDPNKNFKLFWKLLNYPAFPMIYRLQGIHNNLKAQKSLNQMTSRSFVKTEVQNHDLLILKYKILGGLEKTSLDSLLFNNEINEQEYSNAQAYKNQPLLLTWDSTYIKKPPKNQSFQDNAPNSKVLHDSLKEILGDILGVTDNKVININMGLGEYGLDSISLTSFAEHIIKKFPFIELDASLFLRYPTLNDLSEYFIMKYAENLNMLEQNNISIKSSENPHLYLKCPNESINVLDTRQLEVIQYGENGQIPLFLFHAAFGTVQCYRKLVSQLDKKQPVYGIISEGIRNSITPDSNMQSIAKHYIRLIEFVYSKKIVRLGGYSQGGVIAYEVAKQLQLLNYKVEHLIIIDSPYPPIISYIPAHVQKALIFINILQLNNITIDPNELLTKIESITEENELLNYLSEAGKFYGLKINKNKIISLIIQFNDICINNTRIMSNYIIEPLLNSNLIKVDFFARESKLQFFSKNLFKFKELNKTNEYYAQSNCFNRWALLIDNINSYRVKFTDHFTIIEDDILIKAIANPEQAHILCNNTVME